MSDNGLIQVPKYLPYLIHINPNQRYFCVLLNDSSIYNNIWIGA